MRRAARSWSRSIRPSSDRPRSICSSDASKARKVLGWKPKRTFNQLVAEMVASDLAEAKRDAANGKRGL
ncbi:GDP-mannose 4,6-dehydratase [Bradyrhizobium diazoefficiens]|nr:GDP-mannose 4,6-dehydratase [Bradyrhizobium diazoefficiens]